MNAPAPAQWTRILVVAIAVAAGAQLFAWSRLTISAAEANATAADLSAVRSDLVDLDRSRISRSPQAGASVTEDTDLNRRLRAAADLAQIPDQLASIEPGPPVRVRDSEFIETPIYVRLNSISLRELVTFIHSLSTSDHPLRSKSIELNPPEPATAPAGTKSATGEGWTADVTLSDVAFSPKPHE